MGIPYADKFPYNILMRVLRLSLAVFGQFVVHAAPFDGSKPKLMKANRRWFAFTFEGPTES
jgi:hypothetical protein